MPYAVSAKKSYNKENPCKIFFFIKKRIIIPCYTTVQKMYSPFQSVVSKQTLDMP